MTYLEIMGRLVSIASRYEWDDVKVYIGDYGWDPDWMYDYIDDPDEKVISIDDNRRINDVLIYAFEVAHGRRLHQLARRDLLDY